MFFANDLESKSDQFYCLDVVGMYVWDIMESQSRRSPVGAC